MSDLYQAQNKRFKPTVSNVPRAFIERFHDSALFGGPITVMSFIIVGVFLAVGTPQNPSLINVSASSDLSGWLMILAIPALIPAMAGLPAVLFIPLHPFVQRVEINTWARHGYYRECFEPKGYDLRQLKKVSYRTVREHRIAKALSQ